jgi:uncharacterized membrane protein HdeD (DUF308 family)
MVYSWMGNWWALALRAIVAILFGLVAFLMPGPTFAALIILFGIYAIVDGVFGVIAAIRGARRGEKWGTMLLSGILGIVAGIIAIMLPAVTALVLAYLVAAWALLTGALEISAAVTLRKEIKGEWLLFLAGVLSILLGAWTLFFPAAGVVAFIWYLGAYAIATGVVLLALAFRVRQWTRDHADILAGTGGLRV